MRYIPIKLLVFLTFVLPLSGQTKDAPTDLAKTFQWGQIVEEKAGMEFSMRTRWSDGHVKYVAILTDSKGRVAKYFAKHPSGGDIPLSSFAVIFADEEGFELYTLRLADYAFSKQGDTVDYVARGEWRCDEETYKALKAHASYALNYPTELEASTPRKK